MQIDCLVSSSYVLHSENTDKLIDLAPPLIGFSQGIPPPFLYSARGIPGDRLRFSFPLFAPQTGRTFLQAKKKNMNEFDSSVL